MKQARPILHGRDHAPGGADPIPGLNGGGGGELEWEDVGTPGTPAVDPWARYAILQGAGASGGPGGAGVAVVWSSIAAQHSPEGALVDLAKVGSYPAGYWIRILQAGVYSFEFRVIAGTVATGPPEVTWQTNIGYTSHAVLTEYMNGGVPAGPFYPYIRYSTQAKVTAVPQNVAFYTGLTSIPFTVGDASALVERLSP